MSAQVDLYNNAYTHVEHEVYRAIRMETYGRDLGQTSWVTTDESDVIPSLLHITADSHVLELGCGSGLYALHVAQRNHCRITGLDLNPHAIATATHAAIHAGLTDRVRFQPADVSQSLPFPNQSFDAAFANDVLCHIPGRPAVFAELHRVLRPGGRMLFTDALLIGGVLSHQDIATRSSIGLYFFSPPGENERLLAAAGFSLLSVTDTSSHAALIASRWHQSREQHRLQLVDLEGVERYDGLQTFLACVHRLTSERRLLRHLYVAEKPATWKAPQPV